MTKNDYREKIVEIIQNVEDVNMLEYLYYFIKWKVEAEV